MECLSLYRGSIRATWSWASLLGTPTNIKEGKCAVLGYAELQPRTAKFSATSRRKPAITHIKEGFENGANFSFKRLRKRIPERQLLYCGLRET